jgi:hypothetical protein
MGQGHEAVFVLNVPQGRATLRENYGFSRSDLATIECQRTDNLQVLLTGWEWIHGAD